MPRREAAIGWSFLAPAALHWLVFALLPMGYALWLSFFKFQLYRPEREWVFLGNFSDALAEPAFQNALWNSLRFALMSVPAGMAVALVVAILVTQKLPGMSLFRTAFYVPAISSGVAISMLWIYVYLPEVGLINAILAVFKIPGVDFLRRPEWAMPALAFMSIWVGLGPRMVIFAAGLLGVPAPLYEAASLDGASRWRQFWNITLPQIAPTTLFVLVTSTISALQTFTPVYLMTKGDPEGTTDVIGYHLYSEAWVSFNTGLASAKSFLLLLVIVVISAVQFRGMKEQMAGVGE
jgi:multiple sugar transport system permease protein